MGQTDKQFNGFLRMVISSLKKAIGGIGKGQATRRLPFPYAPSRSRLVLMSSPMTCRRSVRCCSM